MERLTERTDWGLVANCDGVYGYPIYNACQLDPIHGWVMARCFEKLAAYEDAEEQGLLLRLPCKVGTEVYQIVNNTDACVDCIHYSNFFGMDQICDKGSITDIPRYADKPLCEKQFLEVVSFKANLNFIFGRRNDFGKTVFLTKEEAEQALAERG